MFAINTKNIGKMIHCPKCGSATESIKLSETRVQRCQSGCGIWINQAELDANRKSKPAANRITSEQPVGLWRSRGFAKR